MAELDRTIAEFRVDPARVYLHGYSMGGGGGYRLACRWPERFAAVVVVAGRVEPGDNYTPAEIELDRRDESGHGDARPLRGVRGRSRDDAALDLPRRRRLRGARRPVAQARRRLRRAGAPVRYTELAGVDHATAPALAYADADLFCWLLSQPAGH